MKSELEILGTAYSLTSTVLKHSFRHLRAPNLIKTHKMARSWRKLFGNNGRYDGLWEKNIIIIENPIYTNKGLYDIGHGTHSELALADCHQV